MRKVIVNEFVTLDGVVQAPISPEEDRTGGFAHAGWHVRHTADQTFQRWAVGNLGSAGGFLFGRRTYEIFAAHWPNAGPEEQVLAEPLNTRPKYVASTTLTEPLAWQNSVLLGADVARAVAALKREDGGDLLVIGSTELVRTLLEHALVDELRLMIDPVLVGGGKRLFPDDGALRTLRLADSTVTTTGAIITTYVPLPLEENA
ncbi:MAG TPA: dihydrofolate reductase family protein [Gemmatimonadaceae bacterium]|nr:dihydrofolate reductase family protein [Gemmatimonadaceae bacterium]